MDDSKGLTTKETRRIDKIDQVYSAFVKRRKSIDREDTTSIVAALLTLAYVSSTKRADPE